MRTSFGLTRLLALPAPDVWHAQTALSLYAVEPRSTATVALNVGGLRPGDFAGMALFVAMAPAPDHRDPGLADRQAAGNTDFTGRRRRPYAWLGVERSSDGLSLTQFVERSGHTSRVPLGHQSVWLCAECDFAGNSVGFRYSTDGTDYAAIGEPHPIGNGPDTAQAIWCSLFSCRTKIQAEGGHADFDSFVMTTERAGQPRAAR